MKNLLKKAYPHLIAIATFIILSSAYFAPSFNGYKLNQGDVKQFRGMQKEIHDYRMTNEEEPLWTNAMFGGMPAYQISVVYGANFISKVGKFMKLGLPRPAGYLFMAMLGFYILCLCLRINPWIGIIGGIAFGFSTINILYLDAGHNSKVGAIAYIAPALGGLILSFRGKLWLGASVFTLFFALNLSSNHFQMTYYMILLMGAVALTESIRLIIAKQYKHLGKIIVVLLLASILAPMPSIGNFLSTLEYSKYTTRGTTELTIKPEGAEKVKKKSGLEKDYILEYNYGKREILSIIAPSAQGERGEYIGNDADIMESVDSKYAKQISQMNRYWGGQRMSGGAFYFGVIMFVFALFGFIFLKDSLRWPLLVIGILSLFLASNNPGGINGFFIDHFPIYNKFRDSKMILVLLQVIIPVMGVLFLDRFLKKEEVNGDKKKYLIAGGVIVLIGIILYATPSISGSYLTSAEVDQFADAAEKAEEAQQADYIGGLRNSLVDTRKRIYQSDMGRAAFLMFLACGLILLSLYVKLSRIIIIGAALIMVTADNMSICKRYLNNEDLDSSNRSWQDETKNSTPYTASVSDIDILNSEKSAIKNFDKKASSMNSIMSENFLYEEMTERNRQDMADFAVLNFNSNYRVLTFQNPFSETNTSFFHKSIGGYHGAKLKRFQEITEFYLSQEIQAINSEISDAKNKKLQQYAQQFPISKDQAQQVFDTIQIKSFDLSDKLPVLNMLNTKYLVTDRNVKPIKNTNANGNAWFIDDVITVNSANDEISKIKNINSKKQVILNKTNLKENGASIPKSYSSDSTDIISMTEYNTKSITYKSNSKSKRLAVFSEIYYPKGWNLYVDNKKQPYFRANYLLRAAEIPAGQHKLEWKFEPGEVTIGKTLGWIGSLLILGLVFFVFGKNIMSKISESNLIEN